MQPAVAAAVDAPLAATFPLAQRRQIPQAIVSSVTSHPSYTKDPSVATHVNFAWAPKGTYVFYDGTDGSYGLAVKTSSHQDAIAKYRLTLNESGSVLVYPAVQENAYCSNFASVEAFLAKLNDLRLLDKTFNAYTAQLEQQQRTYAVAEGSLLMLAQEKARIASYGWYSETLSNSACISLVESKDAKPTRPFVFRPSRKADAITLSFHGAVYRCRIHENQWTVTRGAPQCLSFPTLEELLKHYKLDPSFRGLILSKP